MSIPRERIRKSNNPRCPECQAEMPTAAVNPLSIVVCGSCAAVAICDEKTFNYRLLRTDEWWPIRARPEWYDLCERRMEKLEELTAPEIKAR